LPQLWRFQVPLLPTHSFLYHWLQLFSCCLLTRFHSLAIHQRILLLILLVPFMVRFFTASLVLHLTHVRELDIITYRILLVLTRQGGFTHAFHITTDSSSNTSMNRSSIQPFPSRPIRETDYCFAQTFLECSEAWEWG
jgi:hypothetical protein